MPRPKANQEGPSARERIEQAFWDLLEEKPYRDLTVRELAERAQVNHNTFYYHFGNIDELALSVVESIVTKPPVASMLDDILRGGVDVAPLLEDGDSELRYHHTRLLLGSGSSDLVKLMQRIVFGSWLENLGLEPAALSPEDWSKIDFVWGGLAALISGKQAASFQEYLSLLEGGVGPAAAGLLQEIVDAHKGACAGVGGGAATGVDESVGKEADALEANGLTAEPLR